MRKAIFILFLGFASVFQVQASHFLGFDIHYRYIGDSTGIAHHYEFVAFFYRDVTGIQAPQTIMLNVTSSCFPNSTITLIRNSSVVQGQPNPASSTCVDVGPATGTKVQTLYFYKNTVILPGICHDFAFSHSCGGCRNPTNNGLGTQTFFIQIKLNNTLGPNSSPIFNSQFIGPLCVNRPLLFSHRASEPDGDSLRYTLIPPLIGNNGQPFIFSGGFTFQQPLITVPSNTLVVDSATGVMSFTLSPAGLGDFTMALEVTEYRFNSVSNTWVIVGTSIRDFVLTTASNCSPSASSSLSLDVPGSNAVVGANGLPVIDVSCQDTGLYFKYLGEFVCSSLAADGTDFRLENSNGQTFPIISASGNCVQKDFSKEVNLFLLQRFTENGDYYLYSKVGSDGNTLQTICGFALDEFDTIIIRVTDCPPSSGIGLEQLQSAGIHIGDPMPNPGRDYVAIPINIAQPEELQVKVIGINGQVVWQYQEQLVAGPQKIEVHTANWPSGLYVVVLQTANGVVTRRMELAR
jgi:hypothetical protein